MGVSLERVIGVEAFVTREDRHRIRLREGVRREHPGRLVNPGRLGLGVRDRPTRRDDRQGQDEDVRARDVHGSPGIERGR